jgi:hypothetical protein
MKEEIKKELAWLKEKADDPLHVISNYVYLIAKCYQVGEEIPEEATDLFREAINKLGEAWKLVKIMKEVLK